MTSSEIGIVSFYNEIDELFSESFKVQFARQLEYAFNAMTGIEEFATKRGFMILVGMHDLNIMYKDGYGFGMLEIITPYSQSVPQTFFWKSENRENAFERDGWNDTNIQIGFCADFRKEYFQQYKKRKIVRVIKSEKLKFRYFEEITLYPDLGLTIEFKNNPDSQTADAMQNKLQKCLSESYVSDASVKDRSIYFMIDFQGTEFKIGKRQIRDFILFLNSHEGDLIQSVCLE